MAQLYDQIQQMTFHATNRYPTSNKETEFMGLSGKRNEEMRSMTIAAFRVAQNETIIDDRIMDGSLLYFLVGNSDTAISYWKKEGRLVEGEGGYYLTQEGISECSRSSVGWVALFATQHYDASVCWVNERLLTQPTRLKLAVVMKIGIGAWAI